MSKFYGIFNKKKLLKLGLSSYLANLSLYSPFQGRNCQVHLLKISSSGSAGQPKTTILAGHHLSQVRLRASGIIVQNLFNKNSSFSLLTESFRNIRKALNDACRFQLLVRSTSRARGSLRFNRNSG